MAETIAKAVSDIVTNRLNDLMARNEEAVRQTIVARLLNLAGWSIYDSEEVTPEYPVGSERVDYALRIDNSVKVFIEVKRLGEDLDKHQNQLLDYSEKDGTPDILSVLTNGRYWWLYLPSWKGSWEEKRFCVLDIAEDNPSYVQKRFKDFLLRDRVQDGKAVKFAIRECNRQLRAYTANKAIVEAWNRIVQTPHENLVNLIASEAADIIKSTLDEQLVRDFLNKHENKFAVSRCSDVAEEVASNTNIDFAGKKPYSMKFRGEERIVSSWAGVLSELCKFIHQDKPEEFDRILEIRGSTRLYFSKVAGDIGSAAKPLNNGFYRHGNLGPKYTHSVCERVLTLFGYDEPNVLEIQTSTKSGEHVNFSLPTSKDNK